MMNDRSYQGNTNGIIVPAGHMALYADVHAQKDEISSKCKGDQGDRQDSHASKVAVLFERHRGR